MISRAKRKQITELRAKLHFLMTDDHARNVHGHQTIDALAERCGLSPSTLKTWKDEDRNLKERLSTKGETVLANVCGFDPKWAEWRTGCLKEFKQRYLSEAKPREHALSQTRRTDLPLTAVLGEAELGSHRLASLEMFIQQGSLDKPWPIGIHLICPAAPIEGAWVAVQRGYIDLECGLAKADRQDWLGQSAGSLKMLGGGIEIQIAAGSMSQPRWSVAASAGLLGNILLESALCVIRDVAAEDVVEAKFTVFAKDLTGPQFICQGDGMPLKRNKQAILEAIRADCALGRKDGYAVLCRHKISFQDSGEQTHRACDRSEGDNDV